MTPEQKRIRQLEEENADLRAEIEWLKAESSTALTEVEWIVSRRLGLTKAEWRFLRYLLGRGYVTYEGIYTALFADRERHPHIVSVYLCKMRPRLRKHGIVIETLWGTGVKMTEGSRRYIRALLDCEAQKKKAAA